MIGAEFTAQTLPHATAMPPPQQPGAVEARAVESAERGQLGTDDQRDSVDAPAPPVLRLVRASVQQFAQVLESMDEMTVAGIAGGYSVQPAEQHVDLYA